MTERVEIVVIGGGIAGISVAYELAARREVLLVEAESALAVHTTGRSAALYMPSYGGPLVRALTVASRARFDRLRRELDIPDPLSPRMVLHLGSDAAGAAALDHMTGVRPVTPAEALRLCPVLVRDRIRAVAVEEAMDIDVMAVHQGYLRGLKARGGRVRASAAVTALRRSHRGWQVECGGRTVLAGIVVNAAGAWADRIAALAGVPPVGLRPLRRTIAIATMPGGALPDPRWPMVCDAAERYYFRSESGGVLVSPEDETPSEPTDARPDELDIALALERVNAVTTLGLRSVRSAWAGLRSFVADREPVVGERPAHPGFHFFAGQGGYGIQMSPALAAVGASVILGEPAPEDVPIDPEALLPRTSGW